MCMERRRGNLCSEMGRNAYSNALMIGATAGIHVLPFSRDETPIPFPRHVSQTKKSKNSPIRNQSNDMCSTQQEILPTERSRLPLRSYRDAEGFTWGYSGQNGARKKMTTTCTQCSIAGVGWRDNVAARWTGWHGTKECKKHNVDTFVLETKRYIFNRDNSLQQATSWTCRRALDGTYVRDLLAGSMARNFAALDSACARNGSRMPHENVGWNLRFSAMKTRKKNVCYIMRLPYERWVRRMLQEQLIGLPARS